MKHSIDIHVEFSFKGEEHSPSATLTLDDFLAFPSVPSLHAILARKCGVDTYSYLYEVMEQAEIVFDNAHGLAADCLSEGEFDLEAFVAKGHELRTIGLLQPIAKRELGITDIEQHPALKNALLQAYRLGQNSVGADSFAQTD